MSRKVVEFDKSLQDKIKEFWKDWYFNGEAFSDLESFIMGYLQCYYNGNFLEIQSAIEFFDKEIKEWEKEESQ